MSVYYEIKEHLILLPGIESSVPYLVGKRLAMLGADMLMNGETYVETLRVIKGMRGSEFTGSEITPALKEAIALISEAAQEENTEQVELYLSYEFRWSSGDETFSEERSPFVLCSLLDTFKDCELEKLSYTMWNKADSGAGMGSVLCYGVNSAGRISRGEAPYQRVHRQLIPDSEWYCEESPFCYDGPFTPELAEACRRLSIVSGNPHPEEGETFTVEGQLCQSMPDLEWDGEGEGEYRLNFVSLPDTESVNDYTQALQEVLRLTGETENETELLALHAPVPFMLRLTVSCGSVGYALTQI